jgi:pimeloyl-ACP methyl ester carboxylesterase
MAGVIDLTRRLALDAPPGGVELAWDRWGSDDGRPLVLVHGWSGSAHDFALVVPRLVEGGPVLALDHRGHGRSTPRSHNVEPSALKATGSNPADIVSLRARHSAGVAASMSGRSSLGRLPRFGRPPAGS